MLCSNCTCSVSATGSPPILKNDDLPLFTNFTELDAELKLLEKMARHLEERRMLLKHRINAHSPVGRLPVELFVKIFRECDDATPLQLGSVCQDWRRLVWSTPVLWSSLSIHVLWNISASKRDLLREWLGRAEAVPLHVKVTAGNDCDEALYGVFKILVARTSTWGSIDCVVPAPAHELLENCTFPLLTSVTLRPASSTLTTFFTEPPKMFDATPSLVDLDLLGYNMPPEGVVWGRIRSLKTQAMRVPDLLDIMRCSPGLEECLARKIYGAIDDFDNDNGPGASILDEPLQHLSLTSLDLSLLSAAALPLLDVLALPALRRLGVKYNGPDTIVEPIIRLLGRSGCQLRALDIEAPTIDLDSLILCLRATPLLQDLSILISDVPTFPPASTGSWGKRLLQQMTQVSDEPLLPMLTSLDYYGPQLCDIPDLLDLLRLRRTARQWITNVNIMGLKTYFATTKDMDEIRSLAQSGVSVTIRPVSIACRSQDIRRTRAISNAAEH